MWCCCHSVVGLTYLDASAVKLSVTVFAPLPFWLSQQVWVSWCGLRRTECQRSRLLRISIICSVSGKASNRMWQPPVSPHCSIANEILSNGYCVTSIALKLIGSSPILTTVCAVLSNICLVGVTAKFLTD